MLWNAVGSAKTAYPISHILVASRSKSFPYPSLWLAAIVWVAHSWCPDVYLTLSNELPDSDK